MKVVFIKNVIAFVVMFAVSIPTIAQTVVQYTVERGETIASIAKKYETTEAKIIELNPEAAQFIYVGMKLTIPSSPVAINRKDSIQTAVSNQQSTLYGYSEIYANKDDDLKKWNGAMSISYGFLPKVEGTSGTNYALAMTVGANYNIDKSLYVGARIGYSSANTNISQMIEPGNYFHSEMNSHFIALPIEVGYKLHLIQDKYFLAPYAGLDINFAVKCTTKQGTGSNKEEKSVNPNKLGANGRIGLRINIGSFCLGGAYVFSLDKNYGDNNGFPELSIGFMM